MSSLYPASARRFAPWKNGGGETAEIVCVPEGAGFDAFQWRISTARVAASGPFSVFEGVDRSLSVIEGGAMRLSFGDGQVAEVDVMSGPFAFPGDLTCEAKLLGPALLDFNVMVRRPLVARVVPGADYAPTDARCLARYLFALAPVPGADRHDLLELDLQMDVPRHAQTLIVEIVSPD